MPWLKLLFHASFAFYNTREEVDKLADAIQKVIDVFA